MNWLFHSEWQQTKKTDDKVSKQSSHSRLHLWYTGQLYEYCFSFSADHLLNGLASPHTGLLKVKIKQLSLSFSWYNTFIYNWNYIAGWGNVNWFFLFCRTTALPSTGSAIFRCGVRLWSWVSSLPPILLFFSFKIKQCQISV